MAFEVEADPERNRITVTLTGFATIDDVRRFEQDLQRAHDLLPQQRGPHQLLYDVSAAKIQSQDVVQALRDLAAQSPTKAAFALVNASALAGRQLDRIFTGIDVRRSKDRHDAEIWLDAQVAH
ncbi:MULTISPECIES: hypothetical protein [unclassified Sphingobium]|uniref:hypothetical protein n=1 Tax=unclassified Sphingobium TaxID=2611147 RepID=UPI0035A5948A